MEPVCIAAISINGGLGQVQQSLDAIEHWAKLAKNEGAQLAMFPELVVHGHCTPNTWELAESVPDGPSVRRLEQLARDQDIVLSVGLSEKDRDIVYNTQVLVGPGGYVGRQRKIHLSRDEANFYNGGQEILVFNVGLCRVGTVICYDNLFPEVARVLALRGADVILAPHAARMLMWDDTVESQRSARCYSANYFKRLKLRAQENACFMVIADQAGRAGYVDVYPKDSPNQPHHAGGAFIFGPQAESLAGSQCEEIRDEMVLASLDPCMLDAARSKPNYTLRTRRPELFGELILDQYDYSDSSLH